MGEGYLKYYQGTAICSQHGKFSWDGYISDAEYRFGDKDVINKRLNVIHKPDGDYLVVFCPKCHSPYELRVSELEMH